MNPLRFEFIRLGFNHDLFDAPGIRPVRLDPPFFPFKLSFYHFESILMKPFLIVNHRLSFLTGVTRYYI